MPSAVAPSVDIIREIAKTVPTPFYLYDEAQLRARVRALKRAFSWDPAYKEYFAVKALPNPAILTVLRQEGCGMDCSSMAELVLASRVGCVGEDIMFSSNETPPEEFEFARQLGANINLDDVTHIDFLAAHGGIPDFVCLRYNPGGDFVIGNAVMGRPGDAKFGMTRLQIDESVRRLMGMGVKRFGLHAFLASCMTDNEYYPTMAKLLLHTAREISESFGAAVEMINLSGGIGIPYRPEEAAPDIDLIGRRVKEAYDETLGGTPLYGKAHVVTELGRYVTGPVGWLITKAVHRKDTYRHYIGADACAANLMRPAMYGAYHHITVAGKENAPCDHIYDVVGALCENNDKFAVDRPLPQIDIGDYLIIHDAGAHGFSMGYNYNGRLRSAEVLLRPDGSYKLIRRAETLQDYFATLDFDSLGDI